MSNKKKNKKKKQEPDILYHIDNALDQRYVDMLEEIQFMQADLKRAERKAKKKAIREMKKGNNFFNGNYEIEVRKKCIREMERNNFLERVSNIINDLKPVCVIIARLVMSLIVSILSIDSIKYRIKPQTLQKMQSVYTLAKSVSC